MNIPLVELPVRTFELPPRSDPVAVAAEGRLLADTLDCLATLGRTGTPSEIKLASGDLPKLRLWEPNEFLIECLEAFDLQSRGAGSAGEAWDFACGTGRDAVFLASCGWRVIGFDVLPDALEKAEALATRYLETPEAIEWRRQDLSKSLSASPDGNTSKPNFVSMFFFMDQRCLRAAIDRLAAGGHLILETFSNTHRDRFGKPRSPSSVLDASVARTMAQGLELLHLSEGWRACGRHTVRLLARKPSS